MIYNTFKSLCQYKNRAPLLPFQVMKGPDSLRVHSMHYSVYLYLFIICPDVIQITVPVTPRINIISAAPEPLPVPNRKFMAGPALLIKGSHTSSTINPPSIRPIGMVKN